MSTQSRVSGLKPYHVPLTIEHLGNLDNGKHGADVDRALDKIRQDITLRAAYTAGKPQKRKMTLEYEFTPIVQQDDRGNPQLVGISITPSIKVTTPPIRGGHNDVKVVGNQRPGQF
jgi:hypothetical protein